MKKWIGIMAGGMMILSLAACGKDGMEETTQIANPFVEYEIMEDAETAAGFQMQIPDEINGYGERLISVADNEMLQVIYTNGEEDIYIRKEAGDQDISGDYNEYAEITTNVIQDRQVTYRGNDGRVSVATWTDEGYTYAIDAPGLTPEEMTALVKDVQ